MRGEGGGYVVEVGRLLDQPPGVFLAAAVVVVAVADPVEAGGVDGVAPHVFERAVVAAVARDLGMAVELAPEQAVGLAARVDPVAAQSGRCRPPRRGGRPAGLPESMPPAGPRRDRPARPAPSAAARRPGGRGSTPPAASPNGSSTGGPARAWTRPRGGAGRRLRRRPGPGRRRARPAPGGCRAGRRSRQDLGDLPGRPASEVATEPDAAQTSTTLSPQTTSWRWRKASQSRPERSAASRGKLFIAARARRRGRPGRARRAGGRRRRSAPARRWRGRGSSPGR